ncbi:MAG: ABC transporter ATP-binding protein [Actinomycetota bacterium]
MSDVLQFSGVDVVRSNSTLLTDISWEVSEGERWVILGPNGAGKSTLLNVAAARMHPTRGQVRILGELLGHSDVFDLRPRIGLTHRGLTERIPARESVLDVVLTASYAITGRWRETYNELDQSRARSMLFIMGAAHLADRTFGTLSEGERQRVHIARALMTDPELMLLDEPAAGLDLPGREALVQQLGLLAEDTEAPVLVLVTHHVEEIPPHFTDVLMVRAGRVMAAGPLHSTLTPENAEATFGIALEIEQRDGRWMARAANNSPQPSPHDLLLNTEH